MRMISSRAHSLALFIAAILMDIVAARAEPPVILSLTDATAPEETIGCLPVLVTDEDQTNIEDTLAQVGDELLKAAREALILNIGHPFVLGLAVGQVKGVYPLKLDYCQSVSTAASSRLSYHKLASRKVRIGYCSSPERDKCQAALLDALGIVDDNVEISSLPIIRSGIWTNISPPGPQEMIESVFGLQNAFSVPLDGGKGQPDGSASYSDASPRPLGQISIPDLGAPPSGPVAGPQVPKGFVFAVSVP